MILDSHLLVGISPMFTVPTDGAARVGPVGAHGIEAGATFHPDDRHVADVLDRMPGRHGRVRAEAHPSEVRISVQRHRDAPGSRSRAHATATGTPDARLEASGMLTHGHFRDAAERVGPDRVRRGSDVPYPSVELAKVRVCSRATDQVDRVLGANGRRPSVGETRPDTVM